MQELIITPAFLNLGGGEIFIIVLVILLLFGAKRIPDLAQGFGKGMREVKDAMSGVQSEIRKEMDQAKKDLNNPLDLDDKDKKESF